jgi:hypothetical protein
VAVLAEFSTIFQEMRFGQTLVNLSTLEWGLSAEGDWYADEEELLAAARQQAMYFADHRLKSPNTGGG